MAGRATSGGALGLAIIAAMVMLFCGFLLLLPLSAAWDEDACIANGPGRAPASQETSLWPPGTDCSYPHPGGETTQVFVDAGSWDPLKWPALALLAGAPLTLAAGLVASIRDLRSRTVPKPSRRIGGITS